MNVKARAIVLMSGGLDSMLAAKLLEHLGIEVVLLCFESYFFSSKAAKIAAQELRMDLRVEDISEKQLEIVKSPRYGHGGAINPCIDCHLLMLKTAKEIMDCERFDFVATGEVLGERPMSQNQRSLDIIEMESGLAGFLLRPLSAKLLPETNAEKKGLVDRTKMGEISGRSRKPQIELAARLGITYIPQPGGGCVLTEKEFGGRLRRLMEHCPNFSGSDASILRNCRPIWEGDLLIAVARKQEECFFLKKLAKVGDTILSPDNFMGPTVLTRNFGVLIGKEESVALGRKYLLQYSKKVPVDPIISVGYL